MCVYARQTAKFLISCFFPFCDKSCIGILLLDQIIVQLSTYLLLHVVTIVDVQTLLMVQLKYFPQVLNFSLSIHWCIFSIFHLPCILIQDWLYYIEALWGLSVSQCFYLRHLNFTFIYNKDGTVYYKLSFLIQLIPQSKVYILKIIQIKTYELINGQPMSLNKNKKFKTQKSIKNPFDQSVQLVILSKLQKCYQNLAKGHFQQIQVALKYLYRDLQILRHNKKDKRKIGSLVVTLQVLCLVKKSQYKQALEQLQNQIKLFDKYQDNESIFQIKNTLIKSLILKHMQKEQQSTELIKKAIQNIQVKLPKKPISKHHNKIIQLNLLSIAIIAEEFFTLNLQYQSYQIYKEAYLISNKYLTQYHKITETLQSILKKIKPEQKIKPFNKTKTIRSKKVSLGKSLRYQQSEVRHKTLQLQKIIIEQKPQKKKNNRLKTLEQGLSKSIKQKQFSKIYGQQSQRKCWTKLHQNDNSILASKINSSFLNSEITYKEQPQEMKQLQKIKKMYLPNIQTKNRKKHKKIHYQKKNIVDLITKNKMNTLRPDYFSTHCQKKAQNTISSLSQSQILKNEALKQAILSQTKKQQPLKREHQNQHLPNLNIKKEDIKISLQKQQITSNAKTQSQIKAKKDDAGCQLI